MGAREAAASVAEMRNRPEDGAMVIQISRHTWDTCLDVADAYLAGRPADDADPVTAEWLLSLGLKEPALMSDGEPPTVTLPRLGQLVQASKLTWDWCRGSRVLGRSTPAEKFGGYWPPSRSTRKEPDVSDANAVPTLKLSFRADRPAGVIRAYFAAMDDSDRLEVGTLNIDLADRHPELFERFQGLMKAAMTAMLASIGVPVSHFGEPVRLHHKN
jgi:hypothetical protein